MQNRQYSIITSMKKFYGISDWLVYFWNNKISFFKYYLYLLLGNKKVTKYKRKLFDNIWYEEIRGQTYPIIGHPQLEQSLIRGFLDAKVPFAVDELAENVVLLWLDKTDLRLLSKLKKQGKIKKAVTVPTACKYDYFDLLWNFPLYDCVDRSLVASNWVKEKNQTMIDKKYWKKIVVWPSGVEVPKLNKAKPVKKCICYYKNHSVDENLSVFLRQNQIEYTIFEYGKYNFKDWVRALRDADFAIFYQSCRETQGLAIAEAWSYDVPIFVNKMKDGTHIAPYLTSQNGLEWETVEDLKKIVLEYVKNPMQFLSQFSPRQYVLENMSDQKSVLNLMKIFESI